MSNKLNIHYIRRSFEKEGYTLLSTKYINNKTKLKYKCLNGHYHTITWSMWNSGNRCPYCAKKTKITIKDIVKSFTNENYKLLTTNYTNNKQLLEYICPNGNKGYIRWNDWQQGHRCGCKECRLRYKIKKPKKINFNYIKTIIECEGCTLLTDTYVNNRQKLRIKLKNNDKEYITTWLSWQQGKRPWKNAINLKPTIEKLRELFLLEGYTLLNTKYINSKTKLRYICPKGHKHEVVYYSWIKGYRCPYCNRANYKTNYVKHKVDVDNSDVQVTGIIYKVTNIVNNKVYIGQTVQGLSKRKSNHILLANKKNITTHFHRALNKYGKDNFKWEIVEYCETKEELDEMEFHYIKQYNSYKNGYNMTLGGEGTIGRKCKESTKLKIAAAKTGSKVSIKTKRLLSINKLGIKKSREHVAKVIDAKSKYWEITFPSGNVKIIKNLNKFCRENNLNNGALYAVSNGYRKHHKGFKCRKLLCPVD